MKTEDLISRLSVDTRRRMAPAVALTIALAAACILAAAAMLLTVGPRPDLASAAASWRFVLKAAVTLILAASAFALLRRAVYPEGLERAPLWLLLAAPAVLLMAVAIELSLLPPASWAAAALGSNWADCLVLVPAFGIAPLAVSLWAISKGAPSRPALSGLVAGLLSGGIAATAYAAHCPDDSPLFVLAWYPAGIIALALAGAVLGARVARW